jgi:hypothetical protein
LFRLFLSQDAINLLTNVHRALDRGFMTLSTQPTGHLTTFERMLCSCDTATY